MSDTEPIGSTAAAVSAAMLNLGEMFQQIIDLSAGQRTAMEAAGYSPAQAEVMSAHFYEEACSWLFHQMKQPRARR